MSNFSKVILVLFLIVLSALTLLIVTPSSFAKIISEKDAVSIGEDEVIDDDLFITGEIVTVKGTVNGDLYVAGGVVTVEGTINGDVLAAGGMIDISGTVEDDVRAVGGNILVHETQIGDNLSVAGGNITLDKQTSVGGSITFGSGNFVSKARVERSVLGGGGQVTLDGPIGGDVRVGAGSLNLGSDAIVKGDLVYTSEDKVLLDEAATVSGITRQILPEAKHVTKEVPRIFKQVGYGFKLWSYLAALLVGFVLLFFLPSVSFEIAEEVRFNPGTSLLWGLLILLIAGPALILLSMTVIGIPLAFVLGMLLLIELYLAKILVGLTLGEILAEFFLKRDLNIYLQLAIGLGIYSLLTLIPFVKFFVWVITILLGLGAIFSTKRNYFTLEHR